MGEMQVQEQLHDNDKNISLMGPLVTTPSPVRKALRPIYTARPFIFMTIGVTTLTTILRNGD